VQLYYQIALQGRDDLSRAPDEHAGFVMTLLRMLAFRPEASATEANTGAGKTAVSRLPGNIAAAPAAPAASPKSVATPGAQFDGDWTGLVAQLAVTGVAKELARNAELARAEGASFDLVVPKSMPHLAERSYCDKLRAALEQHLGRPVRLRVAAGEVGGRSVAALEANARDSRRAEASRAVKSDRFVQELVTLFDGRVVDPSVRPVAKDG
jgi:DNA polymerase-3 subunit gamma/tau